MKKTLLRLTVISAAAAMAAIVAWSPSYSPSTPSSTTIVTIAPSSCEQHECPDVGTTTGTFATEKLKVTGTGSDSIIAAGGMQMAGSAYVANSVQIGTFATIAGSNAANSLTVTASDGWFAVRADTTDHTAVRGTRTLTASTRDDAAAIYGRNIGTIDTTSGDHYNYGVRGETLVTKSNVGGGDLYDWGIFGRSGTINVDNTATDSAGVAGLAYGGIRNTYSFYGSSKTGVGNVYGLYTHADNTGSGWTVGAFGYANSGLVSFGVMGTAEPTVGQTTQIGVYGALVDESLITAPAGSWAGYFDGATAIAGVLDMKTHLINNVVDPVSAQDAATKNYVDTHSGLISGLTTNTIPKATSATSIGNSSATDDGTTFAIGAHVSVTESSGATTIASTTGVPLTATLTTTNVTADTTTVSIVTDGSYDPAVSAVATGLKVASNVTNNAMIGSLENTAFAVSASSGGTGATTNFAIKATGTVDVTGAIQASGQISTTSFLTVNSNRFQVDPTTGNTTVLGTLTADSGLRVFDVAGAGLTSTANSVDVAATTGGGLTVNANDIQMTYCAANEVPQMNAGGTAWGCGTAGAGTIGGSATSPGVIYASGANTAATDATSFTYDSVNKGIRVGSSAVSTSSDAGVVVSASVASGSQVSYWSTSASYYALASWSDSSVVYKGSIGYGNASAPNTALRGKNFLVSSGPDFVFNDTSATATNLFTIFMTSGSTGWQLTNGSAGAVGAASTGKLRYNSTSNTFQASFNAAAFVNIVTGTVTANTLPKSASSTTGALTASSVTDDGTTFAINTNKFTITESTGAATSAAEITATHHVSSAATSITSGCGATPSMVAGSTDAGGQINISTTPGTCRIAFGETWTTAPFCVVFGTFGGAFSQSVAATNTTTYFEFAAGTGSETVTYICSR